MTKKQQRRRERLMPNGIPRWVRCYDLGDTVGDRYTVVFTHAQSFYAKGRHPYLAMSGAPFHPQGVGMHGETEGRPCDMENNAEGKPLWAPAVGRKCHLGVRVRFTDLPADCRKAALADYVAYWGLEEKGEKPCGSF